MKYAFLMPPQGRIFLFFLLFKSSHEKLYKSCALFYNVTDLTGLQLRHEYVIQILSWSKQLFPVITTTKHVSRKTRN